MKRLFILALALLPMMGWAQVMTGGVVATNEKMEERVIPHAGLSLEEYFCDAQPIPRNIKKILHSVECWKESSRLCDVVDGVVRIADFRVGGSYKHTIRRFTRGFKGEYYSHYYNSAGMLKVQEGEFRLHKKNLLYYLDGDIIYIPRIKPKKDKTTLYYRLTPCKMSFLHMKNRISYANTTPSASSRGGFGKAHITTP